MGRGYRRVRGDFSAYMPISTRRRMSSAWTARRCWGRCGDISRIAGSTPTGTRSTAMSDDMLVITLSMVCPFEPAEKQALLEAATETERARTLLTLLEMGAIGADPGPTGRSADRRPLVQAPMEAPCPTPSASPRRARNAPIDPRLLEILVCPLTKGPLEYDRANNELISRKAGLAYPVRDGIPIMLPEEARQLED